MNDRLNILVLGFYNRCNTGDDSYISALRCLYKTPLDIRCFDDVDYIPEYIDVVICGGGDIVNDYFMKKAQRLLGNFKGRVYGVSIGIPYDTGSKYLHIFDHVYMRSTKDAQLAIAEIGELNVTTCTDLSVMYDAPKKLGIRKQKKKIGVCLAQPLLYENPDAESSIINSLHKIAINHPDLEFHFLNFNHGIINQKESDVLASSRVCCSLSVSNKMEIHDDKEGDVYELMKFICNDIDIMICMRYHSVMFSILTNTPFLPIYCSSKIGNLVADLKSQEFDIVDLKLDHDNAYKPLGGFEDSLVNCFCELLEKDFIDFKKYIDKGRRQWSSSASLSRYRVLKVDHYHTSFDDILSKCRRDLCKYLMIGKNEMDALLYKKCKFPKGKRRYIDIGRYLCFLVSGNTSHPCLWGLVSNMQRSDFCLHDALKYIWNECTDMKEPKPQVVQYYPISPYINNKRIFVNVDYIFRNDFCNYHRSGWSYVVGGMMNMDASYFLRESNILVDTYVDRSFHWGYDTLISIGVLPYKQPWFGFIHHTFDETHSSYNCVELFKNTHFLESLKCCKGLIVLSDYLGKAVTAKLLDVGHPNVSVHTLYHPMEFVSNMFTMEKFIANPKRRIVQIGAWLRNPYAIYQLPPSGGLQKSALKGREMDMYFPPSDYCERVYTALCCEKSNIDISDIESQQICRDDASGNKFCTGAWGMLEKHYLSVEVIEKLSNEDYDQLLSQNVVFLNLVDCSAVNTVVECIVRDTILLVNRLPALEEILGRNYPGFYNDLEHAARICDDMHKLRDIHIYMKTVDKTKFSLDLFMRKIQFIINNETYTKDNE